MNTVNKMGNPDLRLVRRIEKHLVEFRHQTMLHVSPSINQKLLARAIKTFNLSKSKQIIALLEINYAPQKLKTEKISFFKKLFQTFFKKPINCVLFTQDVIYYRNQSINVNEYGAISYDEFPRRKFIFNPEKGLDLDFGDSLTLSESQTDAYLLWEILESIRLGLEDKHRVPAEITLATEILSVLSIYHPNTDFYLHPNIPEKKLANAPGDKQVLGMIDCTLSGSAKQGLIFGPEYIYYKNDWTGASPDGKITYQDFSDRSFTMLRSSEISLDHGDSLVVSGCSMNSAAIIQLLNALAKRVHWYYNNLTEV